MAAQMHGFKQHVVVSKESLAPTRQPLPVKQMFRSTVSRSAAVQSARLQGRRRQCILAASALPAQFSSVKPAGDRIFVKVDVKDQVTSGGVFLATTSSDKSTSGAVVGVGSENSDLNVGDSVLYSKFAGTEVELGGVTHIILKQDDCVGTLSGDISTLKPLSDRVLIKCQEADDTTTGGLILTEASKEKPLTGEIVAVGPGKKDDDDTSEKVSVGDTVLYSKFSGLELESKENESFIVVKQGDILATLS